MIAPLSLFNPSDGPLQVIEILGDDADSRRLRELGMGTGSTVCVVRQGRPSIVDLGGPRFAIGAELLERVLVQPAGRLT